MRALRSRVISLTAALVAVCVPSGHETRRTFVAYAEAHMDSASNTEDKNIAVRYADMFATSGRP